MAQRVTYRRRKSFNTRSNKIRCVKTPGGKLAVQYLQKRPRGVMCGDCKTSLPGIPQLRPKEYSKQLLARREKSVTRAYGGSRCAKCVRQRIVRAFLVEEQKVVKAVIKKSQGAAGKA